MWFSGYLGKPTHDWSQPTRRAARGHHSSSLHTSSHAVPCRAAPLRAGSRARPARSPGQEQSPTGTTPSRPSPPSQDSLLRAWPKGRPETCCAEPLAPEVRGRNGHQALQRAEHSEQRDIRAPSPRRAHPPATAADSHPCGSRARSAASPVSLLGRRSWDRAAASAGKERESPEASQNLEDLQNPDQIPNLPSAFLLRDGQTLRVHQIFGVRPKLPVLGRNW